jgi:hypothetical protein
MVMIDIRAIKSSKLFAITATYGALSLTLYVLLYLFEDSFLALASNGGWFFLVPVATAFVFSFVHGNFTAYFWDMLGIKAKK